MYKTILGLLKKSKTTVLKKYLYLLVFIVFIIFLSYVIYKNQIIFKSSSIIIIIIGLIITANFYFNSLVIFQFAIGLKYKQRNRLYHVLRNVDHLNIKFRNLFIFYLFILYSVLMSFLGIFFVIDNYSRTNFLLFNILVFVQTQWQMISGLLQCLICQIIYFKYKEEKRLLRVIKPDQILNTLNNVQTRIMSLCGCVDDFNDIFGWVFLQTLLSGICKILIHLNHLIKTRTDIATNLKDSSTISFGLIYLDMTMCAS